MSSRPLTRQERGCATCPPYSPDLNPIELVFAKLKGLLRSTQARTQETLWSAIGSLLERFTAQECRDYIRHCGYYHSG